MMKLVNIVVPFLVACFLLVETILASPSSRGNDEYNITESLEFIIQHPLNKERPASYLLGSPLTEEEIILTLQTVLQNRDKSDLEQVIQLYQVTNGLKTLEADPEGHPLKDIWLIPGYYLLSLGEVVETMSTMKKTSGIWNPTWLPLFASRAGDFLVFDTKNGHIHELFTKESLRWEVAP
ncbi:hypothetical protein CHS0354_030198 [Potamilus streckersoni]|uniref:Uncharacterized protein n=1 Tax=Potamilus streckersoni TaxID=2493646 RepID=A0AAE0RSF7_9BIVA|nr:hypothetical protein CHS0354_030198 [Potamilus streckersoni]